MEIPSRQDVETSFAKKMARLTSKQRSRLRHLMGTPPDPAKVPPSFWADVQQETEEELLAIIWLIYMASANFHAYGNAAGKVSRLRQTVANGQRQRFESMASSYAKQQASFVSQSYAETAREQFGTLTSDHREITARGDRLTRPETTDRLTKIFGPAKATSVTTTTTTAAQSAGGEAGIEVKGGTHVGDQWITQDDQRVCPICGPLHLQRRESWGSVYPDGPPAHVNCRCTIRYVNDRANA